MRILMIGDVIGRAGRDVVAAELPKFRERMAIDFVVANGENLAGGFGISRSVANDMFSIGVDVLTSGNHWLDQKELLTFIDSEERILRPLNCPKGTPGRGANLYSVRGDARILVMNPMGRTFMDPMDDPFACVEAELNACPLREGADAILVDIHAEATSEKMAMGHFCDGRASAVVGTHSHVPTGDAQVLPHGTGYQTDAGACADYDSVIGMDKFEPLQRFTKKMPTGRMTPALGPATMCGVFIETDAKSGLAKRIEPVRIGGRLIPAEPQA
jgi:2',3'-cyclic-nucleotide 2'-phosphodiesterase